MNHVSKLTLAISLILGTSHVMAATTVDVNTASTANTYASELSANLGTTVSLASTGGSTCGLNLTGEVGTSIPLSNAASTITRYFRFDFSGENTELDAAMLASDFEIVSSDTTGSVAVASTSLVGGGQMNDDFVIFSVTMGTGGNKIKADDRFNLAMPNLSVDTKDAAVKVSYTVHTNDVSASTGSNGSDVVESVQNASYINFAPGLAAGMIPVTSTASVEADFLEFLTDANRSTPTTASLGTFNVRAATGVCDASGSQISLSALLGSDVNLEVNGNFEAIQDVDVDGLGTGLFADAVTDDRIYVISSANCSTTTVSKETSSLVFSNDNETATLTINPTLLEGKYLCLERPADSKVIIPTYKEYSLTLKPTAGLGSVGETALPIGDIIQDGTVLESPYFTLTPGYISRFMLAHLMPELTEQVKFSIKLQTDSGNELTPNPTPVTPGLTYDAVAGVFRGTMDPGTVLQINASDLVSGFTTKARGSAVFTFVSTNAAMQGIYQAVNLSTLEVSNIVMPRPGGGTGK